MNAGKRHSVVMWLLIALQLCLLVFFAFNRLVDGDEGFYLSAAREVSQGRTLYADFFYPQMPYLPYIFSVFAGKGFTTLFMTRMASVLAGILTTILFYLFIKRLASDKTVITILMTLYIFSGLIVSWHSVAKTFAWSDLFLMGAFLSLASFIRSPKVWQPILCGALMALAVNTRLVLLPLVVVFCVPFIINSGKQFLQRTMAYFAPLLVFSIPSLIYLIRDTRRFMFDNLGFHFMRNPGIEFPHTLFQKLLVIGQLFMNPQILILLIIAIGSFIYWRRNRAASGHGGVFASASAVAGFTALVTVFFYLLPDPVHQQYFVQAVPFALIASVSGVEQYVSRMRTAARGWFSPKLPIVLAAIYILGIVPYFIVYVGAVRDFDSHTSIGNMKRVCACFNDSAGDVPILTELPIISILANKPAFEGIEFLGFEYPLPLDDDEKRYYRLALNRDVRQILDNRQASYYIVVNNPPDELAASTEANYDLQDTFERFKIYRRKS
jgi:hypothetical protein